MPQKITLEYFLLKSKEKHKDRYNYDKIKNIKNSSSEVIINCKYHGDFKQIARLHYMGHGCKKCAYIKVSNALVSSTESFITKAKKKHNNKYSYKNTVYVNNYTDVIIICKKHGEFKQKPSSHLDGKGCLKCSGCYKNTTNDFITKAKKIHNNKYDYTLVDYNGAHKNVEIICKKHGKFEQKANSHLNGNGCPKCKKEFFLNNNPMSKTTKEFVEQANKVHNNLYDYSKTIYTKDVDYIEIICKKHGIFKQIANYHINGCGCPKCKHSKGEMQIIKFLEKFKIEYECQKKFCNCKSVNKLSFDFYLPKNNICIEFDGEQHYVPISHFGGIKRFEIIKKHDIIKTDFCEKENIKLIRVSYKDNINEKLKKELLNKD